MFGECNRHINAYKASNSLMTGCPSRQLMVYEIFKRITDLLFSIGGIVILSPLMFIVAFSVKIYDGGPVIYKQVRLTKGEKEFEILKFRSMRVEAENDGTAVLSSGEDDDRVTPVGRILREYWLDELPQLFNILFGDMTIVGPRPERPELAEQYYKIVPDFRLRLQVKAGLTGYAQVKGGYNIAPNDKLAYDLMYINNRNPLMDCRIVLDTIRAFMKKIITKADGPIQNTRIEVEKTQED